MTHYRKEEGFLSLYWFVDDSKSIYISAVGWHRMSLNILLK